MRSFPSCALIALLAGFAIPTYSFAQLLSEEAAPTYAGKVTYDYRTGQPLSTTTAVGQYVYDNVRPPALANFGYSEPKTNNPTYGDIIALTGAGPLDELALTLYNSQSGGGNVTGGTVAVKFFRSSNFSSFIGGFNANFTLPSALNPGFYTFLDFTNLATLATPIVFDRLSDFLVTQNFTTLTGTSTESGVVSFNQINIGSSPRSVYLASTATPAGLYEFLPPGTHSDFGYLVGIAPEPGTAVLLTVGALALGLRRR